MSLAQPLTGSEDCAVAIVTQTTAMTQTRQALGSMASYEGLKVIWNVDMFTWGIERSKLESYQLSVAHYNQINSNLQWTNFSEGYNAIQGRGYQSVGNIGQWVREMDRGVVMEPLL